MRYLHNNSDTNSHKNNTTVLWAICQFLFGSFGFFTGCLVFLIGNWYNYSVLLSNRKSTEFGDFYGNHKNHLGRTGLVDPDRDPTNGYREYTLKDVENLKQIKLLRQLGVSIENIRKLQNGSLSLERCMKDRLTDLDEEGVALEHMKSMCRLISDENEDIKALDAALYLDKMKDIEKGGVQFMNVKMSDVNKRKTGAILAAVAVVLFAVAMIAMNRQTDTVL